MKNNIDAYRKELNDYLISHDIDDSDYQYKYLTERLNAEILRDRLHRCKNDNNLLKRKYLDTIEFLTGGVKAKTVADICGMMDVCCASIVYNLLLKFKKIQDGAVPRDIEILFTDMATSHYDHEAAKKEWEHRLNCMIKAFAIQKNQPIYNHRTEEMKKLHQEGMKYFVQYIDFIWI